MSFDQNDGMHNLFGEENEALKAPDGSSVNFHSHDANITPNILLEQLAYVDNFMPDFENDLTSLGAPGHGDNAATAGLGLDDRLAAELSAFADETFIFPDEDKPADDSANANDHQQALNSELQPSSSSSNAPNRSARFLSQRRNNFLASQHDNSRQRFSSRNRPLESGRSPSDDHGGFTNVDISEGAPHPFAAPPGVPYSNSPLSNLVSDSNSQTAELFSNHSNTPLLTPQATHQRPPSSASQAPSFQNVSSNIHMPDYSSIPTRTLLALLPKVRVPSGAWNSLHAAGFDQDQIEAIAAIIAHYQMQQSNESNATDFAAQLSSHGISPPTDENAVQFLLQLLSHGIDQTRAQPQPQSQQQLNPQPQPHVSLGPNNQHPAPPIPEVSNSSVPNGREKASDNFFQTFFNADSVRTDPVSSSIRGSNNTTRSDHRAEADRDVSLADQDGNTTRKPSVDRRAVESKTSLNSDEKRSSVSKVQHPKRKLKEQEMEGSIQELSELALGLQHRIHTLEMENRLLKNLVMERGELKGVEQAESVRRELIKKIKQDKKEDKTRPHSPVEESRFQSQQQGIR